VAEADQIPVIKVSLVTVEKCPKLNLFTLTVALVKVMVGVAAATGLEKTARDLPGPGAADAETTQASPPRGSGHRDDGGIRVVHDS
jgi:hypothetical protein